MNKLAVWLVALAWSCGALEFGAGSRLQIVVPDPATLPNRSIATFLRHGAEALRDAFVHGLGVRPAIVDESAAAPGTPGIFLGRTRAAFRAGVPGTELPDFAGVIAERDGRLFIVGNDRPNFGRRTPDKRYVNFALGSIKALTVFMEEFMQTRFLLPGSAGIDYAKLKRVTVPPGLTRHCAAPLMFSTGRHAGLLYDYAINAYGAGAVKLYGGHSYYDAVPKARYAKTHPEYFILPKAHYTRRDPGDNHLCISNPDVQNLLFAELVRQCDAGAETVELAQTDGYTPCRCAGCRAYGGVTDDGEKLWILHRHLAEKLLRERPGKKVLIISYQRTNPPPRSFSAFPENVMIELCACTPAVFERWKRITVPRGFAVYLYNWGYYQAPGFTPKRTPRFCADQARRLRRERVLGIYRCGHGELPGLEGVGYYVYGKMLGAPESDYQTLEAEFLRRAFHESSGAMTEFFALLHERLELFSRWRGDDAWTAVSAAAAADPWQLKSVLPRNPRILLTAIYSPELLAALESRLSRAERTAVTPVVKLRLRLVRKEFDYTKLLARALHLYQAYRIAPTPASFAALADAVAARNAFLAELWKPGGKSVPGWRGISTFVGATPAVLKLNGRLAAPVGAPLTWDFERLRRSGVLPGVAVKRAEALRAAGAVSATEFDSGAWRAAEWRELTGLQFASVRDRTRFKLLYDDKFLYIGVESTLNSTGHRPVGRDGRAWRQDAVEIALDPAGRRESYYHFVFNPVPDSCYDARFGFISDVLHPLYNQAEPAWNGKWEYVSTVKDGLWHGFFRLPFATVGAFPRPGAVWSGNIARGAVYTVPARRLELALWSPSLETQSFHDREAFGEIIFK